MRRGGWLACAILLGIVVRGPYWIEALRTPVDGDTAIVGLMAEDPFGSITMWGQPYGSPLDAWVALPFVALFGHTVAALRIPVFLLGLALIPLAWLLASRLHREAALPAALVAACPPAYFLLLSSMPPPFYATTLVLAGLVLWVGLVAAEALGKARGGELQGEEHEGKERKGEVRDFSSGEAGGASRPRDGNSRQTGGARHGNRLSPVAASTPEDDLLRTASGGYFSSSFSGEGSRVSPSGRTSWRRAPLRLRACCWPFVPAAVHCCWSPLWCPFSSPVPPSGAWPSKSARQRRW